MNKKIKVIALYLPQFHQIPENDKFWGEGFTEWVTVKNAKPIYEGHKQPRVPLNKNYYDLSKRENVLWQTKLAKKHSIYGFGVYHYWFNNDKNLLTKPAEIMRDEENLPIKYFFVWDNCNWKRSWSNVPGNEWAPLAETENMKNGPIILIPYILGDKSDWKNHYNYVRHHFKSANYEKVNNKPIFSIIWDSDEIRKMCLYWDDLAKEDGFDGVYWIFKRNKFVNYPQWAHVYNYQPHFMSIWSTSWSNRIKGKLKRILGIKEVQKLKYYDYDKVWNDILKQTKKESNYKIINGAFVDYDDSPRRGDSKAYVFKRSSPEKFEKYFRELVNITMEQGKEYIFLTAWNEWGEGAYLEPDEYWNNRYLEVLNNVLKAD